MRSFIRVIFIGFIGLYLLSAPASSQEPYILVLGITQDGGYPHLGCTKDCCDSAWENPQLKRFVVSLALIEPLEKRWFLFEATPDMTEQIHYFRELTGAEYNYLPDAIFVSHAHIGHYTGLMELGKEVMNSKDVPVYTLPRMGDFLRNNGPWSQLVSLKNISVVELNDGGEINLSDNTSVRAFTVPHRDEYSETAGYTISTTNKKYLFIPDIDKWDRWEKDISGEIQNVDIAFLDGTFYSGNELPGRDIDMVPHPFIIETMEKFKDESLETKNKINFIHMNHSNPALYDPAIVSKIEEFGFSVAVQGKRY